VRRPWRLFGAIIAPHVVPTRLDAQEALREVDVGPPQGRELAAPRPRVEGDGPQRTVGRVEAVEQGGGGRGQDHAQVLAAHARLLDAQARVDLHLAAGCCAAVEGAQRRQAGIDGRRGQPVGDHAVDEQLHVAGGDVGDPEVAERGQHPEPHGLLIAPDGGRLEPATGAVRGLAGLHGGEPRLDRVTEPGSALGREVAGPDGGHRIRAPALRLRDRREGLADQPARLRVVRVSAVRRGAAAL
jgi:hypothetical protein